MSEDGTPMSPYKQMQDAQHHLRLGCLWGIIAIIGWVIFAFVVPRLMK
jgi:hypothetical protein